MEQKNHEYGKGLAIGGLLAGILFGVLKAFDRHFSKKEK